MQPIASRHRAAAAALTLVIAIAGLVGVGPGRADAALYPADLRQSTYWTYANDVPSHYARRGYDTRLDYNTDGCSAQWLTVLSPWVVRFTESCIRHDFGYRNFGGARGARIGTKNQSVRAWIDAGFLYDMKTSCTTVSWTVRWSCNQHADLFYNAVRLGGGAAFG